MDEKLLNFYRDALKTVAEAPTGHVPALDRIMIQATGQIAQERLITIIERLVAPPPTTALSPEAKQLKSLLDAIKGADDTDPDDVAFPSVHPSPLADEDLDLGLDEAVLTPEEQDADKQLKARINADIAGTWEGILKPDERTDK